MSIRITDTMRYDTAVRNIFVANNRYTETMTKLASQREINRISDNPLGMSQILSLRQIQSDISLYKKNMDTTKTWLTLTESTLTSIHDVLTRAREIAVSQASATANAHTRSACAAEVESLISEMVSLMNTRLGNCYIFGGTRTEKPPFNRDYTEARIDEPRAASDNIYTGTVSRGGTYSGEMNKTFVIKIVTGGDRSAATYRWSDDGGRTWSAESAPGALEQEITLPEGITLSFSAGTFGTDDIFYVHAYAAGYYNGNSDELSVSIGKDSTVNYGIAGDTVFTARRDGEVEILQVMNDLKTALEKNKPEDVSEQINKLKKAQEQINRAISRCGAGMNRMEIARGILNNLESSTTECISSIEDADLAALSTHLSARETALQACLLVAARLQNVNIMDFFK